MRTMIVALVLLTVIACGKKTEQVVALPSTVEPPKIESVKEEVKPLVVESVKVESTTSDAGSVSETK